MATRSQKASPNASRDAFLAPIQKCACAYFSVQKCACVIFFALSRGPAAGGIKAGGKRPRSGQFDTADDHFRGPRPSTLSPQWPGPTHPTSRPALSRHTYGSTTPPTRLHSSPLVREKVRRRSCYSEPSGTHHGAPAPWAEAAWSPPACGLSPY